VLTNSYDQPCYAPAVGTAWYKRENSDPE